MAFFVVTIMLEARCIMKNLKVFFLVLFFALLNMQQGLAQCAMCRATVENNVSAGEAGIAAGLNFGIMYLFVTPYLAILVIAFLWYKKSKGNAKKIRSSSPYRH